MSRGASQPLSVFSTFHYGALADVLGRFGSRSLERGRRYFKQRRVVHAAVDPPLISGLVVGTDEYEVVFRWQDSDGWSHDCTCPVGYGCKHAVALGLYALQQAEHPLSPTLQKPTPGQRAVAPPVPGALHDLRAAKNSWDRHRPLQRLLSGCPARLSAYDFQELLEEDDPDLLCWRLAGEIAGRANGWLPSALEAFRDRGDLSERTARLEREKLTRELVDWAREKHKPPLRRLRFLLGLKQRYDRILFEVGARLTTPRLDDEPRRIDQLQQLRSQAQSSPGTLSLPELSLLNTLVEDRHYSFDGFGQTFGGDLIRRLLERAADTELVRWADDLPADLAERGGVRSGEPVRLDLQPVRILPALVGGELPRVELHCFFPDGESVDLASVVYVEGDRLASYAQSLIVARGRCWVVMEEPPESLVESFRATGGLEIPKAERAGTLGMLAKRFEHLRPALRARTRSHPVQPLVTLDLREDDWLQLRIFARGLDDAWSPGTPPVEGMTVFEYTPAETWQHHRPASSEERSPSNVEAIAEERPAEAAVDIEGVTVSAGSAVDRSEIWIEAPAAEQTDPIISWLNETGAEPGTKGRPGGNAPTAHDLHVGWWLKISPRRMQIFGEIWDNRPRGVSYLGNDRMRRMLSPAHRVFPKVKVSPSGVDFFAVSAAWEAEGMNLSDADIARLRSASTRFVRLESGWVQRDTVEAHDGVAEVLADLGIEVGGGEQTVTLWQLAHAKPESLDAFERMGADAGALEALRRLRERVASFKGLPRLRLPKGVKADLRPYQKQGLEFLAHASSLGLGTILADDMGLGKTVQALAWLEHLRVQDKDGGPSLVVCPTSVMHNWVREAARFTPKLRVALIERGRERHGLWQHLDEYALLITNYALLRRDLERWSEVELRAAILDEAQNIKNPDADVSRAALQLRAKHRVALTGTPLENRALDLWSIVQFVNPGYLGNRTRFAARYDRLDAPAYVRALLAAKLRPILLRRMKKEVAPELPDRIEERRDCELLPQQRKLYLAELQRSRRLVAKLAEEPDGIRRNRITILAALTRLRQICCHPALAKGRATLGSGKFDALFELLEPLLDEGHKVLVFSQFVECLHLLRAEMQKRKMRTHLLTGQTQQRDEVVRKFQEGEDASVFLISLKAGGTGLNLTAASYVVVFDPWWNPAVEAQAIDRTHRIGQDRTVIAYRLLALGTIEEKIWELQQKKAALVRDVLGEDGFGRSLTRDDLNYLLQEA